MQIQVDNLKINSSGSVGAEFEAGKAALAQGVRRASALVGQLLRLARLDEPVAPLSETVEVGPLLLDCVGDHVVLAEHKGIDLGARMETSATLHGSVEELRVLFANLIDNAVRYTPSGGQVDVSLTLRDGRSVVEVLDTGYRFAARRRFPHLRSVLSRVAAGRRGNRSGGWRSQRRIAERNGLGPDRRESPRRGRRRSRARHITGIALFFLLAPPRLILSSVSGAMVISSERAVADASRIRSQAGANWRDT